MLLFNNSLYSYQAYDPELFSKALPCLTAIGCALSPDYAISQHVDSWYKEYAAEASDDYIPKPVDIAGYVQ